MEKLIFFRHRHVKENDELLNAFKNKLEVNKYILNKLRESLPYDFTDKNIQKTRTHFTTLIEENHGVNFLEAYMLDENKVVAHQLYMFDREGLCGIMEMNTLPEYRRRGIASQLLTDCEKILFEKIQVKQIVSTATQYSKNMFKKYGYDIRPLSKLKFIDNPLNPSSVEVKMTSDRYNTIKSGRDNVKTS